MKSACTREIGKEKREESIYYNSATTVAASHSPLHINSDICARHTCQLLPRTCLFHFLVDLTLYFPRVLPTLNAVNPG